MKLAEGLINRSFLETRISQIRHRISKNLLVQEGEEPLEDVESLIEEYMKLKSELTDLITTIQNANSSNYLIDEKGKETKETLQEALIRRDGLTALAEGLRTISGDSVPDMRYSRDEIKLLSVVDPKKYLKKADKISKEARELDILIQKTNWNVEI